MRIHDRRPYPVRWLDHLDAHPEGLAARTLAPLGALWCRGAERRRAGTGGSTEERDPRVLVVGNLRVGGTGKTPVVADLARRLVARGERVVVVTRGYRAEGGGDEPSWIRSQGIEVLVDSDRPAAVQRALRDGAERVILDDGLQGRLPQALRWVIVLDRDLKRPPRCLPAGPAREGPGALERADRLLVRCEGAGPSVNDSRGLPFRLVPRHWSDPGGRRRPLHPLPRGPWAVLSGLARPQSFEADALGLGESMVGSWRLADHCDPSAGELAALEREMRSAGAVSVICPEKNRERLLRHRWSIPLWALGSEIVWEGDPLRSLPDR